LAVIAHCIFRLLLTANCLLLTLVNCLLLTFFPPSIAYGQGSEVDPGDTIRIVSDLVDLNVSILSRDPKRPPGSLKQNDFAIFENGTAQEIAFFASAETPFDLVLLLDLSGSTRNKLDLIKKSAQRFVEAVPPQDRVALVTFTHETKVVAPLTSDRELLKQSIQEIKKPNGGTNFWDAMRFVSESVLQRDLPRSQRRGAIIVMTDGVDNSLPDVAGDGSQITFDQLIQILRKSDTIILPIYLDTEEEQVSNHRVPASAYVAARQQLAALADESGNLVYHARKLKDLDKVYQQVIRDLGTVYSLGYRPTNRMRDGEWRTIAVQVPARPDLAIRARRGYFAR